MSESENNNPRPSYTLYDFVPCTKEELKSKHYEFNPYSVTNLYSKSNKTHTFYTINRFYFILFCFVLFV